MLTAEQKLVERMRTLTPEESRELASITDPDAFADAMRRHFGDEIVQQLRISLPQRSGEDAEILDGDIAREETTVGDALAARAGGVRGYDDADEDDG
jgi:hypothetical protein